MEQLFDKYGNIQKLLINYRQYELVEGEQFMTFEDFKNKMQLTGYIMHHCKHTKNGALLDVYLFKHDSKYIKTTSEFVKLLDRYRDAMNLMIFTKELLSIYIDKAIKRYPNLGINNYLHKHVIIELNKGPLCSVHTILTPEETKQVCIDLMTHGHHLPAISVNDPQNIWIGGQVNDIIKIEAKSETTGKTIRYRIVTPSTGKIEQSNKIKKIKFPNFTEIAKELDNIAATPDEIDNVKDEADDENEDYVDDYMDE